MPLVSSVLLPYRLGGVWPSAMSVILHHQSPPHLQLHGSPRASQRLFLFIRSLLQSLHHYHDLRTPSQPIVIHPFIILILVQPSTLPIRLFVM